MIWCKDFRLIKDIWKGKYPKGYKRITLSFIEKIFMSVFIFFRFFSLEHIFKNFIKSRKFQLNITDYYVIFWSALLFLLLIFYHTSLPTLPLIILAAYPIVDSINYILCIIFVDRYKCGWRPHSLNRSLFLLMFNYFEIITGFAILYLATSSISYSDCNNIVKDPLDALYFSAVTITTLGYGDMIPINWCGRLLSILEPLLGFTLIILVLGIFISGEFSNK